MIRKFDKYVEIRMGNSGNGNEKLLVGYKGMGEKRDKKPYTHGLLDSS